MKQSKNNQLEECLKLIFPTINWENYKLVNFEKVSNTGKFSEIYYTRMMVTIEETTDIPKWFDKDLWHAHGYVVIPHEDRPIRDNVVTITERRKRWKHKETWKIYNSEIMWVETLEWSKKPEDILYFLK
jgi:hypothetical protein